MDVNTAHALALRGHAGQLNRFGEPIIDHLERVARAVPVEARTIAFLHDVLERADTTVKELRANDVTEAEHAVLKLLTHRPHETYEDYVLRIARARGRAGRLARTVKLADLDDHLSHAQLPPQAPNYAWARRQIVIAQERDREWLPAERTPAKVARKSKRRRKEGVHILPESLALSD
ncbi:MAG TPA: hypothetical protein VIX82_12215 [Solirubrobacteraceae bacterium]